MRASLKGAIVALALLVSGVLVSPSAQSVVKRGWATAYNLTVQNVAYFADGTAAAPSITFASDTDTGFYRLGADQIGVAVAGTISHYFSSDNFDIRNDSGKLRIGQSSDVILARDAAGILSLNHSLRYTGVLFAALGTPTNGTVTYCSDCAKATPCAGAGTGAIAKRLNGAWDCD